MSIEDSNQFEGRKKDHIKWSLDESSQLDLALSDFLVLNHHPFPDLNFDDVELKTTSGFFKSSKPLMVSSMTGGHDQAYDINSRLLKACESSKWIFAMGSLRRELEEISINDSQKKRLGEWTELLKTHEGPVVGNLGLAQVITHDIDDIKTLINTLKLSGLFIHLNPLQEVLQNEGTPQFKGGRVKVKELCSKLDIPVFFKETGSGFSKMALEDANDLGIAALDVSGLGGTHWGRIEGLRSKNPNSLKAKASKTFKNWGVTTKDSLLFFSELSSDKKMSYEVWSSGGLRTGLDAAISFALGAKLCGFAKPLLEAAMVGQNEIEGKMSLIEFEIKVALFCNNSSCIMDLQSKGHGELLWI
jgi:isopentenyl-diphosphate delta-isomerase